MCAILAAGSSSRMGSPKALLRVGERTLLERAFAAAAGRRTALVVSDAVGNGLRALPPAVQIVRNDEPQRGMSHSLGLADAALGVPEAALIVLLVDTPFVDAALVARVLGGLGSSDVAYPVRSGIPGHPVIFGPRARLRIAALAPGDTLRALRDDPGLRRSLIAVDDDGPFMDVDTPQDFERMLGA